MENLYISFGNAVRLWNIRDLEAFDIAVLLKININNLSFRQNITTKEFNLVSKWLQEFINMSKAKHILGLKQYVFTELVKSDIIKPVYMFERSRASYYKKEDIRYILDCACHNVSIIDIVPNDCVSILESIPNCSTAKILQAILDKNITPVGLLKSSIGLPGLLVRVSDLPRAVAMTSEKLITAVQARILLGVSSPKAIDFLIEKKMLSNVVADKYGKENTKFIIMSDIINFQRLYILASDIAKLSCPRLQSAYVKRILKQSGVLPVLECKNVLSIYKRADVEHIFEFINNVDPLAM